MSTIPDTPPAFTPSSSGATQTNTASNLSPQDLNQLASQAVALRTETLQTVGESVLLLVTMALLGSLNVTSDTSSVYAKNLSQNAEAQQQVNQQLSSQNLMVCPDKATDAQMTSIQTINQNITNLRQNYESLNTTLRQASQSTMQLAQGTISNIQQIASEVSATLKVLTTVSQLIGNLSSGK